MTGKIILKAMKPASYSFCLLLCGYSIAARFAGLIGAGRNNKIIQMALSVTGLVLVVFLLYHLLFKRINFRFTKDTLKKLILINTIFAGLLLIFFSSPPPFPEAHTLIVTPVNDRHSLSDGTWVNVLSIERVSLPAGTKNLVYPSELALSGSWSEKPDQSVIWQGGESGSIQYNSFFQGGISLRLETGPARGLVKVNWDGVDQILDLYSPVIAERSVWLPPPLSLVKADLLRQAMVSAAYAGEWLALGILFLVLEWLVSAFFSRRLKIFHARVLAAGLGVLSLCFLSSSYLAQPVEFPDPQVDRIVRKSLQNFDKPIFKYQLLKIARLDASGRGITNLNGIEYLQNLVELDLRDNNIKDITPLGQLDRLQYLNLRGNQVQDISPLARISSLYYLNLHSNYGIQVITPLKDLTSLETLILANIPIGNQGSSLENLTGLKELNLRGTGLTDGSFLSGLNKLEYLNLHSNPGLRSISPLSSLVNLQTLILQDTPVGSQVEILHNFSKLTRLNLRNSNITDVSVLAELMDRGTIQDNPVKNISASLDVSSNPVSTGDFAALQRYWTNISNRVPFKLPETMLLTSPAFSHPAGFYVDGFYLGLSSAKPNTTVHYTLDGSEPTQDSPEYAQPIHIDSREGEPAILSQINNTSLEWEEPRGEVFQATVVRARVFDRTGGQSGPTLTSTYFVDKEIFGRYSLPVISLVTKQENLFSYESGIYVTGKAYDQWLQQQQVDRLLEQDANYLRHGAEWERPVHIEFFETDGTIRFSSESSLRISGNSTREYPQKSLRIMGKSEDNPQGTFNYPLFPGLVNPIDDQPVAEFSNFLLKNFGNDWSKALIRDPLMHTLLDHTSLDTQAFRPAIVFINGEYWGIHNLRQRPDEYYLAASHKVDPDHVVILDDNQILFRGAPGDELFYKDMLEFISENDIQDENVYSTISSQIDVDNFIDYQAAEIYAANTDWPLSNTKYWRSKDPGMDGRWRWILYDTDRGFGYDPQFEGYNHRTLETAENIYQNGFLLYKLLQNDKFQVQFINRWADHLNTSFRVERVIEEIDSLETILRPEMGEHIRRWRTMEDDIRNWHENVEYLREFARNRPDVIRLQILERFAIQDMVLLTVETDSGMGYVRINSIDIVRNTPGVNNPDSWSGLYFSGIPLQVSAVPYPGYQFLGWEGAEGENPNLTVNLSSDANLKARFSKSD